MKKAFTSGATGRYIFAHDIQRLKKLREAPLRKVNRYFRKQWVSRLYHSLVSEQRDIAFPLCFVLTMFTISQTTEEYRRIDFHTKVLQSLLIEVS